MTNQVETMKIIKMQCGCNVLSFTFFLACELNKRKNKAKMIIISQIINFVGIPIENYDQGMVFVLC